MAYFNNAKDFLIALQGPQGPQGVGATWYCGTGIDGVHMTGKVYENSDVDYANAGDMYLNKTTCNVYQCTLGGDKAHAKWAHRCNIKGNGSSGSGGTISSLEYLGQTTNDDGSVNHEYRATLSDDTSYDFTVRGVPAVNGDDINIEVDKGLTRPDMAADAQVVGNRFNALEDIIENMASGGTGYVENIKSLNGEYMRFFIGTQAEYVALPDDDKKNLFAIIKGADTYEEITKMGEDLEWAVDKLTNDVLPAIDSIAGISEAIENVDYMMNYIEDIQDGTKTVKKAKCDGEGNIIADTYARKGEQQSNSQIVQEYDIGFEVGFDELIEIGNLPEGKTIDDIVEVCIGGYDLHIKNNETSATTGQILLDQINCYAKKILPVVRGDSSATLHFSLDTTITAYGATGLYDPYDGNMLTHMSFEVWLRTKSGDGVDQRKLYLTLQKGKFAHFMKGAETLDVSMVLDTSGGHQFGLYSIRKAGANSGTFKCLFA